MVMIKKLEILDLDPKSDLHPVNLVAKRMVQAQKHTMTGDQSDHIDRIDQTLLLVDLGAVDTGEGMLRKDLCHP
jgi:hypothetical protein